MTSATTQPTFDPQDVLHWSNVLHNAARVPKTAADYDNARAVVQLALGAIGGLHTSANAQEGQPGILPTAAVNFGQGASLGAASQLGDALTQQNARRSFGQMAQGMSRQPLTLPADTSATVQPNTDYLAASRQANPGTAMLGDLAGTAATGYLASPLVKGMTPGFGGATLGAGLGTIRGAIEPLPGFTRGETATLYGVTGGVVGGVSGYLVGKFITKVLPNLRILAQNVTKAFKGAPSAELQQITEQAVRQQLLADYPQIRPEVLERTLEAFRTGKVSRTPIPAPPSPRAAPTLRPGETVVPIAPKGPAPPATKGSPQTFWEQVYGSAIRDKVPVYSYAEYQAALKAGVPLERIKIAYYPRGGAAEQAVPPIPRTAASNPSLGQAQAAERQMQIILDMLKSTPPEQRGAALAGLRSLGIPMGGSDADLLAVLQNVR